MKLNQWLDNFSIGTKVNFNLVVIFFSVLIFGFIGFYGVQVTYSGFREFRLTGYFVSELIEINRQVNVLQRSVEEYTRTGSEAIAIRAENEIESLHERLVLADQLTRGISETSLLERMSQHLQVYQDTFELAKEEWSLRSILINQDIKNTKQSLLQEISKLRRGVSQNFHPILNYLEAEINNVEGSLFLYLHDPDIILINTAQQSFDEALVIFNESELLENFSAHKKSAQLVYELSKEYERLFLRIVQATRGYLFLTSVVMAGEAQEFNYVSNQLRQVGALEARAITSKIDQSVNSFRLMSLIISLIVVMIGAYVSWIIARSISKPIDEITNAFSALVAGKENVQIPGTNRKDEIGVMAQAAKLVEEKNQQTKELLDQSNKLREEVEKSNKELETFAYAASHDLQEPLRVVTNYMSLLTRKYSEKLDDTANRYIGSAIDATQRMMTLIGDLLTYSRVTTRGGDIETADLNNVVETVIENLEVNIKESRAKIDYIGLPFVSADQSQMVQLIQNLCNNSIKYRRSENPHIEIDAEKRTTDWLISVQDNGIGIEEKFKERVFEIFQRLHTREEYPGSGVGLALCKRIVERHNGKIWLESEFGKGTTFFFTIPD